jgi:predicted Fe-Mo cluster-binding NifX family protein
MEQNILQRVTTLKQLGVGVLICGAISKPLAESIHASGIQVLPFVTGSTEHIVNAYKTDQLSQPQYTLPGFWPGARRSFHRRHCRKGGC